MTLAWYDPTNHHVSTNKDDPLFTPLGQLWPLDVAREWVGLTDEERNKLWRDVVKWGDPSSDDEELMKALEAKLKEKNT